MELFIPRNQTKQEHELEECTIIEIGVGPLKILRVRISLHIKLFFLFAVLCQRDKMSFREAESVFVEYKKKSNEYTAVTGIGESSGFWSLVFS